MVLGRPLEFDPEQALEEAMDVFWRRGYENTSLQDLLGAMELSKSSLYQTFGSKQQLFERCVQHYLDVAAEQMLRDLESAPSGRRFIEETFLSLADSALTPEAEKGCLLMNTASEFGQSNRRVGKLVAGGMDRLAGVFRRAVERAQGEGEISASKDPAALGRFLMSSMSGTRTMMKAGLDAESARGVVQITLGALG